MTRFAEASLASLEQPGLYLLDVDGVKEFRRGDSKYADVLRVKDTDGWIDWVLLTWIGDDKYEVVACGYGSGPLREARHTYFGDKGYIYYVNAKTITWAFERLKEWFDLDG